MQTKAFEISDDLLEFLQVNKLEDNNNQEESEEVEEGNIIEIENMDESSEEIKQHTDQNKHI